MGSVAPSRTYNGLGTSGCMQVDPEREASFSRAMTSTDNIFGVPLRPCASLLHK